MSRVDLKAGPSPGENLLQPQGGMCSVVIPPRASQTQLPSPEGNLNLPKQLDFPLECLGSSDGSKPGIPWGGLGIPTCCPSEGGSMDTLGSAGQEQIPVIPVIPVIPADHTLCSSSLAGAIPCWPRGTAGSRDERM